MRVAAVQLSSTSEKASNLEAADRHVRAAAADGAKLIVLPEKWPLIAGHETLAAGAEALDGPAVQWAKAIAAELEVDLIAGSVTERRAGRERLSNTSLHVGPDGEIEAAYRKLHMFDVEIEGKVYRESAVEEPGSEIVLSELDADGERVKLGLTICYDLRFPELFRILALRGAQIVTLPSAFTLPTTRDHWDVLVRARAIENQTFMIAVNQVGAHGDGYESGGRSMIVDPWGVVLAQAPNESCHIVAELDFERQREVRAKLPSLANRREDAYRWPELKAAR
jgi:deaminated glutathione amidase